MSYYLVHTTYLFLFIAVLARQLCLPVPANLFLLSGGALGLRKIEHSRNLACGCPWLPIGGSGLV